MSKDLVKASDFGIDAKQEKEMMSNLPQLKKEREVLALQYDAIIKMDLNDPETSKQAKEIRLLIRDNRTKGITPWRKAQKDYFLQGGRFVDAIANRELIVNQKMEEDLLKIEQHQELIEKAEKEALQKKRVEILSEYSESAGDRDLTPFTEAEFKALVNVKREEKEDAEKARKRVEDERLEDERLKKIEDERKQKEIDRLNAEAAEREAKEKAQKEITSKRSAELQPLINFIRDYNTLINLPEADYQAQLKDIERGAMEHLQFEADQKEKQRIEQEEKDAELRAALEAKEKAEAIVAKQKADQEAKEKAELEAQEKELSKGDAEKLKELVMKLENLKDEFVFKSKKNQKMYSDFGILTDKLINHITK